MCRVILEDQDLNNEFFNWLWLFWNWLSDVTEFKGTNVLIFSGKEDTGSPQHGVAIEMHTRSSLDTPKQIAVEDKLLGDHVFDT